MNFEDALKELAMGIWKEEIKDGCGCLVPFPEWEKERETHTERVARDKAICDKIKATHFSREWVKEGKTVKLTFFKNDAFGAASGGPQVYQCVVNLDPSGFQELVKRLFPNYHGKLSHSLWFKKMVR